MTAKKQSNGRLGVFLCQCGGKIDGKVDLTALEKTVKRDPLVTYTDTLSYSCMAPGLKAIRKAIEKFELDRVVVAGCEGRLLQKKFERELESMGLQQGQIEMVNLRDHVAQANDGTPEELATKGARLVGASVAALDMLIPTPKVPVTFEGPVMILGGGIATYSGALELVRRGIDTIIAVSTDDPEDEIRMLHEHYPGERHYHDRLRAIMDEVYSSEHIKKISVGELEKVLGRTGNYTVTFAGEGDRPPMIFNCGAIIAALDGQMLNQGSDFGHDGVRVVCQTEMEEYLWLHGAPQGKVVFWINDLETPGRPWAFLASRTAWNMAQYIRENSALTQVTILYNNSMNVPLSAAERARSRQLGIKWVAYDEAIRPTVQNGYITYNLPEDQIERELAWDILCLSPLRSAGLESLKVADILGFDTEEGHFLERNPQMVRPEQVGQDEKYLAGSARRPCDLREALRQGRRAATQVAELVEQAREGLLYAPRMVCSVDSTKCIGCGLCNEICDCGGIEPFEGKGGNIPRQVDPMVCTGGGTCAAACPYHALTLQNNTTDMREARVAALVKSLEEGEIAGFGCNWGGVAAADHAGLKGLKYDRRFHMLPVGCIGQLDPCIIGRAFLEGANGLLLIGCPPEECHHSYGLDHTWSRINLVKKLLTLCGLERERVALAHADMTKAERFGQTVGSFMATMDELGPINRDEATSERIQAMYDTLQNPRVRWVLGAGLRRPHETHYPADQRNALAYDESLSDVLSEEFVRTRVLNLLKAKKETMHLRDISSALGEDDRPVLHCLRDLAGEGAISLIYKDRTPYYVLQ
jgi:heterodisulfide reductase subunit A